MPVEKKTYTVNDLPIAVVDFLRPYAERDGRGSSDSATLKFAATECMKRLRREEEVRTQNPEPGTAEWLCREEGNSDGD